MFRKFEITDTENNKIKFKVWPNLAPPNTNRVVYDRADITLTVETNKAMMELIEVVGKFMDGNTINKVEIVEIEE